MGLNKASYQIGERVEFLGHNLSTGRAGERPWIRFEGTFHPRQGDPQQVSFDAPGEYVRSAPEAVADADADGDDAIEVLRWARLGPYANPFSRQGEAGTFRGTIRPVLKYDDDGIAPVNGSSEVTEFTVEPSIEIVELQPVGAECGMPARIGFGGVPYRVQVRAMGFVPESFEYLLTGIRKPGLTDEQSTQEYTTIEREAYGFSDELGEEEGVVFVPPTADTRFYTASVHIRAKVKGADEYVQTYLPFEIHRPIEVSYNGNYEVAQVYEPRPVSGCIPGTIGGSVTYAETQTEILQQTVSVSISKDFMRDYGISRGASWGEGYGTSESVGSVTSTSESEASTLTDARTTNQTYSESETNSLNHSTENGEEWQSRDEKGGSVKVEGEVGVPLVANGKVGLEGRYNHTWVNGGNTSRSQDWGKAASSGTTKSISGSYALSNSSGKSRSFADSTARSDSKVYNFGGGFSESERIAEGMSEAEASTWSRSDAYSTLTSYSGRIPVGRSGVIYRQTTRMARIARVTAYNACGVGEPLGEMVMNEWVWAPDIAIGPTCDGVLPPSNFPEAKCYIEPCD